ncbi:cysteine--tRNA ligase CPS1 homolog, chloroplastic/mitochondrial isoform X2 [Dendrobium catenatum]|uniref:cysteine--tRNA ligase CPS1 homolog, chloroplastic/mitochondrial isoform X2 n=1 Tax=Dendrobium catenatum TaxID=906689 RepID=UPI0009F1953E|nr:cysteine--tRNA ligase CPS1 homolog, chloroplastic/mitochondrial isoform X2 [Dendrobium catenatum]
MLSPHSRSIHFSAAGHRAPSPHQASTHGASHGVAAVFLLSLAVGLTHSLSRTAAVPSFVFSPSQEKNQTPNLSFLSFFHVQRRLHRCGGFNGFPPPQYVDEAEGTFPANTGRQGGHVRLRDHCLRSEPHRPRARLCRLRCAVSIIARANELGEDPLTLSNRYCTEFQSDMAHLHCLTPTFEPRVSTHMSQIIHMIKQILVNGFAYSIDGDVYFSVDKYPSYGQLSGRRLEDNQPGQRVAVDSRKQNPADFALWKASKDGEPFWESPWGPGRPGWHIECSAMSATYLGHSFDIHGGGMDLVFPHHENEIAQSCAACKESNVNYWVHNGFVDVGSEKMSKSLGNFVTIRQVIEVYHPLALRLFLIGTHYRSTISYSIAQLEIASDRLYYIYQTICDCDNSLNQFNGENLKDYVPKYIVDCINKFLFDFEKSLADDLHTPIALASFSEPLKIINDLLHTRKGKKEHMRMESLMLLGNEIKDGLHILGLKPSSFSELREKALKRAELTEEQVLQKIEERSSARKAKLYEKSDVIRKELAAVGITLMDGADETSWRPAVPLHVQEQLPSAL